MEPESRWAGVSVHTVSVVVRMNVARGEQRVKLDGQADKYRWVARAPRGLDWRLRPFVREG
jgi:hypothetical protein